MNARNMTAVFVTISKNMVFIIVLVAVDLYFLPLQEGLIIFVVVIRQHCLILLCHIHSFEVPATLKATVCLAEIVSSLNPEVFGRFIIQDIFVTIELAVLKAFISIIA